MKDHETTEGVLSAVNRMRGESADVRLEQLGAWLRRDSARYVAVNFKDGLWNVAVNMGKHDARPVEASRAALDDALVSAWDEYLAKVL